MCAQATQAPQAIQHVRQFSYTTELLAARTVVFTCLLYGCLNIVQPICAVTCGTYGKIVWVTARGLVDVRIFVLAHDAMHGALSRYSEVGPTLACRVLCQPRLPVMCKRNKNVTLYSTT